MLLTRCWERTLQGRKPAQPHAVPGHAVLSSPQSSLVLPVTLTTGEARALLKDGDTGFQAGVLPKLASLGPPLATLQVFRPCSPAQEPAVRLCSQRTLGLLHQENFFNPAKIKCRQVQSQIFQIFCMPYPY